MYIHWSTMKSQWKLVTCHCQHTTNLNGAWRGQSCKHHFGHLFNTTLKHSSLSSSCYFPCIVGWDVGSGYTDRLDRIRLCRAVVQLGGCPAPWNPRQGTPVILGDGVVGVCSQGQATWVLGRKGVGSTDAKHSGPAGASTGKQSEECGLCIFLLGIFPLQQCLQLQWLKHHS